MQEAMLTASRDPQGMAFVQEADYEEVCQLIRELRILAWLLRPKRDLSAAEASRPADVDAGVAPAAPAAGSAAPLLMWGDLQLLEQIGQGTFGEVHRAFDTRLQRAVALKLSRAGALEAPVAERLLREGRHLAKVWHPNVVCVHDAQLRDGRVGLSMELIHGVTLEQLLQTRGRLDAHEAAQIGRDICDALAAVHAAGLVHRDVKAGNVMRDEGGRVVLIDFGASEVREDDGQAPGRVTGTPFYLAPEVLHGGRATIASDIYSLGVLLFHLVTGDYPVRGTSVEDLKEAHREGRVTMLEELRPGLPAAFREAVEHALRLEPRRRYSSALEMRKALARAARQACVGAGF
jgi:eukaryotic-like serine/threonine-protein kinase